MKWVCHCWLWMLVCSLAHGENLKFITHELRPFTWKNSDGSFSGISFEICRETIRRMGYQAKNIEDYPFPRALKTLQTQDNIVVFHVARTPSREHTLQWVGPILESNVYVYANRKHLGKLHTLNDLKTLAEIGVGRGNASEELLRQAGFSNLYDVTNEMQAFKMLALGRLDAIPVSELVAEALFKQGFLHQEQVIKTPIILTHSVVYMGFSQNIPPDVIRQWQTAMDQVKAEKYAALYKKYINPKGPTPAAGAKGAP